MLHSPGFYSHKNTYFTLKESNDQAIPGSQSFLERPAATAWQVLRFSEDTWHSHTKSQAGDVLSQGPESQVWAPAVSLRTVTPSARRGVCRAKGMCPELFQTVLPGTWDQGMPWWQRPEPLLFLLELLSSGVHDPLHNVSLWKLPKLLNVSKGCSKLHFSYYNQVSLFHILIFLHVNWYAWFCVFVTTCKKIIWGHPGG